MPLTRDEIKKFHWVQWKYIWERPNQVWKEYMAQTWFPNNLIEIKRDEIDKISSELNEKGFQVEIRFGSLEDALAGVIKLNFKSREGDETIDLILGVKRLPKNVFQRAIDLTIFEQIIPVVSPEDLIVMKLLADSPLDIQDAQGIIDVLEEKIDMEYLSKTCRKLRLNLNKLRLNLW